MELHKCPQPGCNIEKDGKCLEGHDHESCPFYQSYRESELNEDNEGQDDENNDNDKQTEINDSTIEPEYVKLYSANALNFEECNKFIRSHPAILIVLAGKFKCGKTTVITALIQIFQQESSFAGFQFAGSRSLIGFEQRCHLSRFESRGSKEDTSRTTTFDFDNHFATQTFLHLRLEKEGKFFDFLIADISGEAFDELTTSTDLCKKLTFLNRCDNFTLIFDADALSDLSRRAVTKTKTVSILRSLIDANMLLASTHIQVLFSKWDLLIRKENANEHTSFVQGIEDAITREFSSSYPNISFLQIASRPVKSTGLKIGHGLDDLLKKWATTSVELNIPEVPEIPVSNNSREFLKYKFAKNVSK